MSNYADNQAILDNPAAETVVPEGSFLQRFWWIIPAIALLVVLPFILY